MELGMIGLGRMGSNMVRRLLGGGHRIVVYDPVKSAVRRVVEEGAEGAEDLSTLVSLLAPPRAVWVMVPSGEITQNTIDGLAAAMSPGDTIIDGGNSNYRDTMKRGAALAHRGIHFLDAGTSGGIWGLKEGYCLMVGGDKEAYGRLEPVFRTLAPGSDRGYGRVGPGGSGHFVKMVHNGIEYGLMQAYAEGFELMQAKEEFSLDMAQISEMWRHGSVVRSWLLDLAADSLKDDPGLLELESYVDDSGEGRWTVEESVELAVPLPVITQAVQARFRSRQENPFAGRLLAALRSQFGGHAVRKSGG
jgi:6-phosphogluconate dehydrogenase